MGILAARSVQVALTIAATSWGAPSSADLGYGFHAAYALGGRFREPTFTQGADLFAGIGSSHRRGNRDGMWSSGDGSLFGLSAAIGAHDRPTYLIPEYALVADTTLAGVSFAAGPALRIDHAGYGLSARIHGDLFLLQIGVRVIAVAAPKTDGQVTLTLGLGRF